MVEFISCNLNSPEDNSFAFKRLALLYLVKMTVPYLITSGLIYEDEAWHDFIYGSDWRNRISEALKAPAKMTSSRIHAIVARQIGAEDVDRVERTNYDVWGDETEVSYSPMTFAWFDVYMKMSADALPFLFFYLIYTFTGWGGGLLAAYIEHYVSNFAPTRYIASVFSLIGGFFERGGNTMDLASIAGFGAFIYSIWRFEYRQGTNAIRHLRLDYYSDPTLLPSLLYLLDIREHQTESECESNALQKDDISLGLDQFLSVTY